MTACTSLPANVDLTALGIYNVKDPLYGAVGDGVTVHATEPGRRNRRSVSANDADRGTIAVNYCIMPKPSWVWVGL